jgi:hypothetical protein
MPAATPDALYWQIKLAAGAVIVGLQLPGILNNVYGQLFPNETSGYSFQSQSVTDIVFPCVLLTSEGETEEMTGRDSESYAGIFPQRCWIADRVNPGMASNESVYLTARKTLVKAFDMQKLAGRPEVRSVSVQPGVIVDPKLPSYQFLVSGMVLKFNWGQARY